jgi:hypothetical protein
VVQDIVTTEFTLCRPPTLRTARCDSSFSSSCSPSARSTHRARARLWSWIQFLSRVSTQKNGADASRSWSRARCCQRSRKIPLWRARPSASVYRLTRSRSCARVTSLSGHLMSIRTAGRSRSCGGSPHPLRVSSTAVARGCLWRRRGRVGAAFSSMSASHCRAALRCVVLMAGCGSGACHRDISRGGGGRCSLRNERSGSLSSTRWWR